MSKTIATTILLALSSAVLADARVDVGPNGYSYRGENTIHFPYRHRTENQLVVPAGDVVWVQTQGGLGGLAYATYSGRIPAAMAGTIFGDYGSNFITDESTGESCTVHQDGYTYLSEDWEVWTAKFDRESNGSWLLRATIYCRNAVIVDTDPQQICHPDVRPAPHHECPIPPAPSIPIAPMDPTIPPLVPDPPVPPVVPPKPHVPPVSPPKPPKPPVEPLDPPRPPADPPRRPPSPPITPPKPPVPPVAPPRPPTDDCKPDCDDPGNKPPKPPKDPRPDPEDCNRGGNPNNGNDGGNRGYDCDGPSQGNPGGKGKDK